MTYRNIDQRTDHRYITKVLLKLHYTLHKQTDHLLSCEIWFSNLRKFFCEIPFPESWDPHQYLNRSLHWWPGTERNCAVNYPQSPLTCYQQVCLLQNVNNWHTLTLLGWTDLNTSKKYHSNHNFVIIYNRDVDVAML